MRTEFDGYLELLDGLIEPAFIRKRIAKTAIRDGEARIQF